MGKLSGSSAATTQSTTAGPSIASGGERPALFVPHADPFDLAVANRVGERVERTTDQTENVPDADLLEDADQQAGYRLYTDAALIWSMSPDCTGQMLRPRSA